MPWILYLFVLLNVYISSFSNRNENRPIATLEIDTVPTITTLDNNYSYWINSLDNWIAVLKQYY